MHTKKELLEFLRLHNIRLKKRFGQNYLIDQNLCQKLVSLCGLKKEDEVIEIGSGLGALTEIISSQAGKLVAIELDSEIFKALKSRLSGFKNIEFVCMDVLDFQWSDHPGSFVIGAIPYSMTSPIIANLCDNSRFIKKAYLGLQIELARRICANPTTKDYGRFSILVQYHFRPKLLLKMPRSVFFPQPEIDSAWICLEPVSDMPMSGNEKELFFDIVRAAFSQRRKTLINCICNIKKPPLDKEKAKEVILESGLSPNIRAEELSIEDFARVASLISRKCLK